MTQMIPPRLQRCGAWLTAICATSLLPLALGCASPGPPRAPSLRLPETVKDLGAVRSGNQVELQWTTPSKTTDGLEINPARSVLTAEICRYAASGTAPSEMQPPCTPVKRLPVQPGSSLATDSLPPSLTADPSSLLVYLVRILNANQRSAGESNQAFAAAGAAPPPVQNLRATPVRNGVMLEWDRQNTAAATEINRVTEAAAANPAASAATSKPASSKPASKPGSKPASKQGSKPASKSGSKLKQNHAKPAGKPGSGPANRTAADTQASVKLQTPHSGSDPGGTIDSTALTGTTYGYTAERIRTVTAGSHSLELRSLLSPAVTVLVRDTFPPGTPTRLAAIPGEDPHSIDLSWEPDMDPDLAGYIVYRQDVTAAGALTGAATRLTSAPVRAPAFRDETAVPGQRYAYRVSAIDNAGNESAPSADVIEIRREQ